MRMEVCKYLCSLLLLLYTLKLPRKLIRVRGYLHFNYHFRCESFSERKKINTQLLAMLFIILISFQLFLSFPILRNFQLFFPRQGTLDIPTFLGIPKFVFNFQYGVFLFYNGAATINTSSILNDCLLLHQCIRLQ